MNSREVVAYLRSIHAELDEERKRLVEEQGAQPARHQQVGQDEESAWTHMLGTLVPNLEPKGLDRTAARLSLPLVAAKPTGERRSKRQQQLAGQIAKIEADGEYQKREHFLNEAEIRLPDLEETAAPLRADLQALEAEPLWGELLHAKYGTPEYKCKWYQRGYFRDWKFGDRIVAKHGPRMRVGDFGALRAKYLEERQAVESFQSEIDTLNERTSRIRALVAEYEESCAGLANLDDWVVGQTRALVREHLSSLTLQDITPLVQDDPALLLAAKRMHGAQAKVKYLDAIAEEWLSKPLADIEHRIEKVQSGIEKFSRPSKSGQYFERAVIEAKYGVPADKWRQRWDRYQSTTQEVIVFNAYDRVDPLTQFLWWDMMCHSHHGNFVPDVYQYHQVHVHQDVYVGGRSNDDLRMNDAS